MIDQLKSLGRAPRFHGNGFTQLYLNENQRLHVWDKKWLPPIRDHNATIHDHIWDMESEVLMGRLIQREFHAEPYQHGDFRFYSVDQEAVRANKAPFYIAGVRAFCDETRVYELAAGSTYRFPAHALHSSDAEGRTATLMTKGEDIYQRPRIVAPHDEPPVNAFDPASQPDEDAMWDAILRAINEMPHSGYLKLHGVLQN